MQVCSNPEKVALRASHLTEDVIIASQVPKRKECDLDALVPVNAVNFYNLDVRQALAATPEVPTPSRHQAIPVGPAPRPAPPKILPIPQVNPYAAAVAASLPARRPFGLSSNNNRAAQPAERKQPSYIIVEDPPVKSGKKIKTVEASPYAASPSLAGKGNIPALSAQLTISAHSKWNFQKAFHSQTIQNAICDSSAIGCSISDITAHETSLDAKLCVY